MQTEKYKMKILYTIGSFGTGGKERQLTELIKALPKDNYECHLFLKNIETYYMDGIKKDLKSYYNLDKSSFSLLDIIKLVHYINKCKPDIVHCFSALTSHFAIIARLFCNNKFIIINGSIRDAPVEFTFLQKLEKYLLFFYQNVVANSNAGLKAYGQLKLTGRHVIYNGIDLNRVRKNESINDFAIKNILSDKFVVTMIANFTDYKDHFSFIRAAKICLNKYNHIIFIFVGKGYKLGDILSYLEQSYEDTSYLNTDLMNENDIDLNKHHEIFDSKFVFLGEVSNIEDILSISHVSVLLSPQWHGEGLSNTIIESLALGVPVIATETGGNSEVIKNDTNGYLVKTGDYISVAEKIMYLKENQDKLVELGINAKDTIERGFRIERMTNDYVQLYKDLIDIR